MREQARNTPAGRNGNHPPAEHRWKPGESGNPNGRPKGSSLTARLRALLEQDDGDALDAIARAVVDAAKAGDAAFVRMVWERLDGRVTQAVEVAGVSPLVKEIPADDIRGAI